MNEQHITNGRIKVAYTMDIVTKSANNPNSPDVDGRARSPSGSVGPGMSTRGSPFSAAGGVGDGASVRAGNYFPGASPPTSRKGGGLFGQTGPPGSASVVSGRLPPLGHTQQQQQPHQPQYPYDMGDDSYYDELIDPDPRKHVEFPFNIHILEMSTLDLIHVHQFKRNQPIVKVFCDTFYSETKVLPLFVASFSFNEVDFSMVTPVFFTIEECTFTQFILILFILFSLLGVCGVCGRHVFPRPQLDLSGESQIDLQDHCGVT